jgi:Amino acid kinase family
MSTVTPRFTNCYSFCRFCYYCCYCRGGSDLTATVIGAAVGADEVQVWKDVDGMMTADPRAVAAAVPVPCVSYEASVFNSISCCSYTYTVAFTSSAVR